MSRMMLALCISPLKSGSVIAPLPLLVAEAPRVENGCETHPHDHDEAKLIGELLVPQTPVSVLIAKLLDELEGKSILAG